MPIDISANLIGVVSEPIYPGPEVDPSTVDWMNLPTRWVAAFSVGNGGMLHVPLPSVAEANGLNLNSKYRLTINEG